MFSHVYRATILTGVGTAGSTGVRFNVRATSDTAGRGFGISLDAVTWALRGVVSVICRQIRASGPQPRAYRADSGAAVGLAAGRIPRIGTIAVAGLS